MPSKTVKTSKKSNAQIAIAKAGVPSVVVYWYVETHRAAKAEEEATREAFGKKWTKGGEKRDHHSKACGEAWSKEKEKASLTAGAWLKARHKIANYPTWLPLPQRVKGGKLPSKLAFNQQNFRVAALNCGYGVGSMNLDGHRTGVWQDDAFAECMSMRTQYLLRTIDFAALRPQQFTSMFETSDRADVSFLVGSATTYLVADQWFASGKRKLKSFWHFSLYCAALVMDDRDTVFKNKKIGANEKAPDFIAIDDKDEVHLFESKGGEASKNNEVLRKALGQLMNVKEVSLYNLNGGSQSATVATRMAVRTVVEPNRNFEVHAYDPPATPAGSHLRIEFNVARGLQALESERLFENLPSLARQLDDALWVREIDGTHLVMCSLAPYRELKLKLRAFLEVKQALPDFDVTPSRSNESDTGESPWRVLAREKGSRALAEHDTVVKKQFDQALAAVEAPGALLPELSRSLGIPALMADFDTAIDAALLQLHLWGDQKLEFRVLPGLLIHLVNWDGDVSRRNNRPAGPKLKI